MAFQQAAKQAQPRNRKGGDDFERLRRTAALPHQQKISSRFVIAFFRIGGPVCLSLNQRSAVYLQLLTVSNRSVSV
jgi:hypothetical protein